MISKVGVFVCELESKGRKYEVEVAAVLEVSRTKKGRSKEAVSEDMLSDGLSDCRLSRPGEPVQPEDRGLVEFLVHDSILVRTVSRVPRRQPRRFPCRYPAPRARRQLFNADRWAI